jgi:hypothetical protein
MGKYDELRERYSKGRDKFEANREACIGIIEGLVDVFAKHLECEKDRITLHPAEVDATFDNACSVVEAIRLGGDNAWHFQLGVTFAKEDGAPKKEMCVFGLSVGALRLGYEIFVKGKNQKIPMPTVDKPAKAHAAFCSFLYDFMKLKYQDEFLLFDADATVRLLP